MKKSKVIQFCSLAANIFTLMVIIIALSAAIFGEYSVETSSLFSLGNQGLSIATLLQILLLSVVISLWEYLLFHSGLAKNRMAYHKTVLLIFLVFITAIGFIIGFGWFSENLFTGWILFISLFLLSTGVSIGIASFKIKTEDALLNQKFKEYITHQQPPTRN